jgi:hypothetical protein
VFVREHSRHDQINQAGRMTNVLAMDLATVTGWARGSVGSTPVSGSIRFGTRESGDGEVFGQAIGWMSKLLEMAPRPDIIVLEAMLPPGAKVGATNSSTRDRLAGLHAIVRGVAHIRGISEIACYSVGDIRHHFIGERSLRRAQAKAAIVLRCEMLGWQVVDNNAADACAAWSYACSIIDPTQALKVSPLFNKQLRVHVQ